MTTVRIRSMSWDGRIVYRKYTVFDKMSTRAFDRFGHSSSVYLKDIPYKDRVTWHELNYARTPEDRVCVGMRPHGIVLKSSLEFLNKKNVYKHFWFHTSEWTEPTFNYERTIRSEIIKWDYFDDKEIRTGEYHPAKHLHVGNIQAAMYRRHPHRDAIGRRYLHVLRVPRSSTIYNAWEIDDGDPYFYDNTITRYINTYEAVGSTSLVGRGDQFEYVDTIVLPENNECDRVWEMPKSVQRKIRQYL